MSQAPRNPGERILAASNFARIGSEATVLSVSALGAYGYGLARYGAGPEAATLAFTSLASSQLLHAASCRSETHSVFDKTSLPPNPYLTAALAGSFGAQILTFVVPQLRSLLGITPIGIADAAVVGASILLPFAVNEASKRKGAGEQARNDTDLHQPRLVTESCDTVSAEKDGARLFGVREEAPGVSH